jgi:hypothetical protein
VGGIGVVAVGLQRPADGAFGRLDDLDRGKKFQLDAGLLGAGPDGRKVSIVPSKGGIGVVASGLWRGKHKRDSSSGRGAWGDEVQRHLKRLDRHKAWAIELGKFCLRHD